MRNLISRYYLIVVIFIQVINLNGQNLVLNPGFEKFNNCPSSLTNKPRFDLIPNWWLPTMGTSDYFNKCSYNCGVPRNIMGYMEAYEGYAFAGLITVFHFDTTKQNITREYIENKLLEPLRPNQKYVVSFQYALAQSSKYATNKIGVYFSQRMIDSSIFIGNLPFKPQIESTRFVYSTDGWVELKGVYTAKGGEQFLIIGNFEDNKQTKWKVNKNGTNHIAYYYIDNVIVAPENEDFKFTEKHFSENQPEVTLWDNQYSYDIDNEIKTDSWYVFNNITFDFDKYEILENAYKELDELVKVLIINPKLKVVISGHTDNIGNTEYNNQLSVLRAEAVSNYIIKNGIPAYRVSYQGFGSKIPLNKKEGIQNYKNRRVEFKFVK